MLTVVTFLYSSGWRPGAYGVEHARGLRAMLRKHLTIPHRFIVIDDFSIIGDRSGLICVPCWDFPKLSNEDRRRNYVRLRLFHEDCKYLGEQILQLDLDTVIRANINDLVTRDSLKLLVNGNGKQFGGAMWLCRPGIANDLWDNLERWKILAEAMRITGSDQAILTAALWGKVPTWDARDGIVFARQLGGLRTFPKVTNSQRIAVAPKDWRLLTCSGGPRPWEPTSPFHRDYQAAIV